MKLYTLNIRFRDKNEPASVERERQAKLKKIQSALNKGKKKEDKISLNKAVIHAIMNYPL